MRKHFAAYRLLLTPRHKLLTSLTFSLPLYTTSVFRY